MCAHKLFTYSIRALIIKHSSEHIAKFEAKVVKMISIKSVSLKRLLQQLKSLCARSKVKSVNYFDCVPFPRFPADPFFAVYITKQNTSEHPYIIAVCHIQPHQHSKQVSVFTILVLHAN